MAITKRPVWSSRAWSAASCVLAALLLVVLAFGSNLSGTTVIVVLVAIALTASGVTGWALLRTRRQRREFEEQLASWAGERAVQAERLRIARDLHDLASHGLGLMTVRAATANLTGEHEDAERRQALTDIERTGREATAELRQLLTVLRDAETPPGPLRPAESLDDLPEIIAGAELAGLTVHTDLGDLGAVAASAQLTVCAIVREALANSARHAGPTTASVTLRRAGDLIRVSVHDNGPVAGWHPQPGAGHGLTGLRERLAAHRGTLTTDARDDGFRVLAELSGRTP
ncbi:signal transduction histidine kinase [Tamaricihabitans halophyticus]|uniref:histidine kinase n=1 Tax=Tamaricihabitans halophyticus TaxID=1262583 RepID=A0A4R2R463_9PSEU|nr:histidine kinase [Tamaricihabitans halophyticus]TCP54331.1 signal transduction histidine kinase [Tamaricihabitans halophyticus]